MKPKKPNNKQTPKPIHKSKNVHSSILAEKRSKIQVPPYAEYLELYAKSKDRKKDYIEVVAGELIHWADRQLHEYDINTSFTIAEFRRLLCIPMGTWDDWVSAHPILKDAILEARTALGIAREAGVLNKRLDVPSIHKVQWHYSEIWREANDVVKDNPGTIHVHIPSVDDLKDKK